jgi:photosystem II stability/assembly factor-like uncharacterized protein
MKTKNNKLTFLVLALFVLSLPDALWAKKEDIETTADTLISQSLLGGLKIRSIGPAWCSGRIADFAVNPKNPSHYIVGVASGNVWKTKNNGMTWKPIFDKYGSYSIGDVEIDPNNSDVIWVGTGENNHQRALGYGDGIYKSVDGGESFENMGLKDSRQIGGIVIDPKNSDVVFVACEGSAWGSGGNRGLYKTKDGGKTWNKVLEISENTGVNNVVIDPTNPALLYATSEQRRRTHFGKIGGGPESAVYKSTDHGETWRKIMKGLPKNDIGGMGIAVSPVNPSVVYLIMEAQNDKGGFFRSTNKGESWSKMNDYTSSGQYYNEIYCDPIDVDKVFSTETFTKYTLDGGKTWTRLGNNNRHVDDHALWIDPRNTDHLLIGGDGGIYETYDNGKNWRFIENLPVTQFYRVAVDNDYPFYNVYGGTQDNNSMGGPSQNLKSKGVASDEWIETLGGDGFWQAIDPIDPNIVYSEYQYGNMVRYDKKSGEKVYIKPRERKGEKAYKWNWDSPMILSSHSNTRLYSAANKVFRSDDRGQSWQVISEDLTAQVDRDSFQMMDKYWSADAVKKHISTSQWGTIVSLDESKVQEGLIYAGTDDGVISVTEDKGQNWHQVKTFPGVPQFTYCSDIQTDKFDRNVVYAAFDNMKRDDFKAYLLKSKDKGKNWFSIAGNLPDQTIHSIQQDFVNPNLLFVGTELGAYFTIDGGVNWVQLKSGMPVISVRDIAIQERECDLVLATFGRGIYILHNYAPLRELSDEFLEQDASLFPVQDALMFNQKSSRDNQGSSYFYAKNPDYGATFTYYLKELPKSNKEIRNEEEKELFKNGEQIPQPTWRELQLENKEVKAHLIFTISDKQGKVIDKIEKTPAKGINRITWNLQYPSPHPVNTKTFDPLKKKNKGGKPVMPGTYTVELALWNNGVISMLCDPVKFQVVKLENTTFRLIDMNALDAFNVKITKLVIASEGAEQLTKELIQKIETYKQTLYAIANPPHGLLTKVNELADEIEGVDFLLNGVPAKASWEEVPPAQIPVLRRVDEIAYTRHNSSGEVTQTEQQNYAVVKDELPPLLDILQRIVENDIPDIETQLNALNAPWTPGRIPVWNE